MNDKRSLSVGHFEEKFTVAGNSAVVHKGIKITILTGLCFY